MDSVLVTGGSPFTGEFECSSKIQQVFNNNYFNFQEQPIDGRKIFKRNQREREGKLGQMSGTRRSPEAKAPKVGLNLQWYYEKFSKNVFEKLFLFYCLEDKPKLLQEAFGLWFQTSLNSNDSFGPIKI